MKAHWRTLKSGKRIMVRGSMGGRPKGRGQKSPRSRPVMPRAPRATKAKTRAIMATRRSNIRARHPNWSKQRMAKRMNRARRNTARRRGSRY